MNSNNLNASSVYGLLLAIGVLGGLGDAWICHWATSNRLLWMMAACVVHIASVLLFGLLLKWDSHPFSSAFMLSSVVHVLVVAGADIFCFGGRPSRVEWAGFILAAFALVLIEMGRSQPMGQDDTGESDKLTPNNERVRQ